MFVVKFGEDPVHGSFFSFNVIQGGVPEGGYSSGSASGIVANTTTFFPEIFSRFGGWQAPPFWFPGLAESLAYEFGLDLSLRLPSG